MAILCHPYSAILGKRHRVFCTYGALKLGLILILIRTASYSVCGVAT